MWVDTFICARGCSCGNVCRGVCVCVGVDVCGYVSGNYGLVGLWCVSICGMGRWGGGHVRVQALGYVGMRECVWACMRIGERLCVCKWRCVCMCDCLWTCVCGCVGVWLSVSERMGGPADVCIYIYTYI